MSIDLLLCWLMISLRAGGILAMFPALGGRSLPAMMRVGIGATLSTLLYGIVRHASPQGWSWVDLLVAALGEVLLGLCMGFVVRLLFGAVEFAGRTISTEVGLAGVPGIDTPLPASEPLAAFFSMFAGVIFFLTGAHLGVVAAFARSFDFAPAGHPVWSLTAADVLVTGSSRVIELGFRIAAPFFAINFLITLAFSVLGRAVPRVNVFVLSFSVRTIIGFSLLGGAGALLVRYLMHEFQVMPLRILDLVTHF